MKRFFGLTLALLLAFSAPAFAWGNDNYFGKDYETVAASQTAQVLGPNGATGDVLRRLIVIPATVSAGNISIKDGSGSAISVLVTGTLSNLTPIVIDIDARSTAGAWSITTGADVSVIAVGDFS